MLSSYTDIKDSCCSDVMRYAYAQFDRRDTIIYEPYRFFLDESGFGISSIESIGAASSRTKMGIESYCWTKIEDFEAPQPSDLDFMYKCGDSVKNVDYNTIKCGSIQYKGWIRSIDTCKPISLCESVGLSYYLERLRIKNGSTFLDDMRVQFFRGAFSNVLVDCVDTSIDKFAGLVLDESATGITLDTFKKIQTIYGITKGHALSNIMVFLSFTAFDSLMTDIKTNHPNCCSLMDTAQLDTMGYMFAPLTGIKFAVVPDDILEHASGHKQWMLALNRRYNKFIPGSSYLNAETMYSLLGIADSCYKFKNLSGQYGMFNVLETVTCGGAGKLPGLFISHWMLNTFIKGSPKGVVLIKGKV